MQRHSLTSNHCTAFEYWCKEKIKKQVAINQSSYRIKKVRLGYTQFNTFFEKSFPEKFCNLNLWNGVIHKCNLTLSLNWIKPRKYFLLPYITNIIGCFRECPKLGVPISAGPPLFYYYFRNRLFSWKKTRTLLIETTNKCAACNHIFNLESCFHNPEFVIWFFTRLHILGLSTKKKSVIYAFSL